MSFSSETKSELCALPIRSKVEAMLELSAMARLGGSLLLREGESFLRFVSEHSEVIRRAAATARFLYGVEMEIRAQQNDSLQQHPVYFADLPEEAMKELLVQSGMDLLGHATQDVEAIYERLAVSSHATAYLRGAFLAGGSLVDPEKSYHLEIVAKGGADSDILQEAFHVLGLSAKRTPRGEGIVAYLKDSEAIADFLIAVGASGAMLKLENVKARKELHNEMNRISNAEAANLDKQYQAALMQIRTIQRIAQREGLDHLPDSLRTLAEARLAHPMANLRELGEMLTPPIGKSGVGHRMRRLMERGERMEP